MLTTPLSSYLNLSGTIRSIPVEETLKKITPYFSALGITRVANITGLDCIHIPVAVCIRPNAKHLSVSQGKGLSWELAQASAIMEAVESYHAENPMSPDLWGTYKALSPTHPIINPNIFADGNFTIPDLENYPLAWIETENLLQPDKKVYIPHILINLDSSKNHPEYSFFSVSTNGLAAGNTKEEAIVHAICELIERDALCRWAALPENDRKKTQLNIDTIDSPINLAVIQKLQKAGQLIKVWDITSNLGIPSFHCVIQDTNPWRNLGMFAGTGTHLSKEVALSRALTEAAQSRLVLISGNRDDIFSDQYQKKRTLAYSNNEHIGNKDYQHCEQISFDHHFQNNIAYLCNKLSTKGFKQVLVVDHTKPELEIPVVHAFIPGLLFNGSRI